MKLLLISLSLLVIVGCEEVKTVTSAGTVLPTGYSIICIDHVEYLSGVRSLSPHLKTNGKPYFCKGAN